jgi:hypothetical protein
LELQICDLAGPLPARHRRTRRKYVPVALLRHPCRQRSREGGQGLVEMVGVRGASGALRLWCVRDEVPALRISASAPVECDHAVACICKRVCHALRSAFSYKHRPSFWRGVLAACGTVGGMDAAIEPPGMGSRRIPRAARAPCPRHCGVALAFDRTQTKQRFTSAFAQVFKTLVFCLEWRGPPVTLSSVSETTAQIRPDTPAVLRPDPPLHTHR